MTLLAYFAVVLFATGGAALVVKRKTLSEAESMLAGGRIGPGCVMLQALLLLTIGAVLFIGARMGWFS